MNRCPCCDGGDPAGRLCKVCRTCTECGQSLPAHKRGDIGTCESFKPDSDRAEALRAVKWIREFCEGHHAQEPAGVHLHRLLVDVPHYLDYVIAVLDGSDVPSERRP